MKGVVRLKIPSIPMTPKLFVITLSNNGAQRRFTKVAFSLDKAIDQCWYSGYRYTMANYINHSELSVDEINSLFKSFRP